ALECPETRLPIRAEQLLMRAGLTDSWVSSNDSSSSWWNFHGASGGSLLVPVYDQTGSSATASNAVRHPELFEKFRRLFGGMTKLSGLDGIERIYAINNPELRSAFEIKREMIERQHLHNPG